MTIWKISYISGGHGVHSSLPPKQQQQQLTVRVCALIIHRSPSHIQVLPTVKTTRTFKYTYSSYNWSSFPFVELTEFFLEFGGRGGILGRSFDGSSGRPGSCFGFDWWGGVLGGRSGGFWSGVWFRAEFLFLKKSRSDFIRLISRSVISIVSLRFSTRVFDTSHALLFPKIEICTI